MRLVSLVPSMTATLAYAGLKDSIVGCTNFCVDPSDMHRTAKVVGGTKDPDLSAVAALRPDLILVNQEENRAEDAEQLKKIAPLFVSFPKTPEDVVEELGRLADRFNGNRSLRSWQQELQRLLCSPAPGIRGKAIDLIWKGPYMGAGDSTFISALLERFGFQNPLPRSDSRYPELTLQEIAGLDLDYLFLSTEPYPFRKRDVPAIRNVIGSEVKILKAEGKLLSWHGYHTIEAFREFAKYAAGQPQSLFKEF